MAKATKLSLGVHHTGWIFNDYDGLMWTSAGGINGITN